MRVSRFDRFCEYVFDSVNFYCQYIIDSGIDHTNVGICHMLGSLLTLTIDLMLLIHISVRLIRYVL